MKWYIAGPMTGVPQHNVPAFQEAAKYLRRKGHECIVPIELDEAEYPGYIEKALADETGTCSFGDTTWGDFLARDVKTVSDDAEGVCLLTGWHKSKGARLEAYVGFITGKKFARLGMPHGLINLSGEEVFDAIVESYRSET